MAAPTQPLVRTETVTLANPTPPTNVLVQYQGTPPTPVGTAPSLTDLVPDTGAQMWLFADPLNSASAQKWPLEPPTNPLTPPVELSGKAEGEGTEVTTAIGNSTGHSTGTATFTESPNSSHPSMLGVELVGSELVTGGDFAATTGWTLSGLATIGTGTLNMGGGANSTGGRAAAATLTPGNYQFQFDVTATDGTGQVSVIIGGIPLVVAGSQAVGHYSGIITTDASSQLLQLRCITGVICKLDNFSVKRVL